MIAVFTRNESRSGAEALEGFPAAPCLTRSKVKHGI